MRANRWRTALFAVLALVLAAGVAACGSSNKKESSSTEPSGQPGKGNVVVGGTAWGIEVSGAVSGHDDVVQGNKIGTDATGTVAKANQVGIVVDSPGAIAIDQVRFPRLAGIPRLGDEEELAVPRWMGALARHSAALKIRRLEWAYPGTLSTSSPPSKTTLSPGAVCVIAAADWPGSSTSLQPRTRSLSMI